MDNCTPNGPRFVLYGILGTYNYGTESIVRGTAIALRKVWPECDIVYTSPRPVDDGARLLDSGVRIVPRVIAGRGSLRWAINSALRRAGLGRVYLSEGIPWLRGSDCVLSVGGDLYTLPPMSDGSLPGAFYGTQLMDVGDTILSRGVPLVVWGASIGPFESWPSAKRRFTAHLSQVSLITAREPATAEYLVSLGVRDNVRTVADPAFLTPTLRYPLVRLRPDLPLLGVNLSSLSARYALPGSSLDSTTQMHARALVQIARRLNIELILLPHVVGSSAADDDKSYLERVYDIIQPQVPDRVTIVTNDPGARRTKGILARCDAVIAARMHCGIHAASVGTPALFLAYSAKARGMARYIYGNEDLCVALADLGTDAVREKIASLLRAKESLRAYLLTARPRFADDAYQSARFLHELLDREGSVV